MKTWARFCLFVAALSALASNAALLDHYSPPHPVLDHLIGPLHARSIDVARDPNVAHLSTSPAVVTLLSGKRARRLPNEAWVADFKRGSAGAVLGVRAPASGDFFKTWSAAMPEKRVFIAFTRADAPLAGHIKMKRRFAYLRIDADLLKRWEDRLGAAGPPPTAEATEALRTARDSIHARADGFGKRLETVGGLKSALGGADATAFLSSISPGPGKPKEPVRVFANRSFDYSHLQFMKSFDFLTMQATIPTIPFR
jgi:hypothetical protein